MSWQTGLLALLVVLWAAAQYGLAVYALRDLGRRPRVRGNNKVLWGLVILAVPIAGPLIYSVYGPTSFIRRPVPPLATATPIRPKPGTARVSPSSPRPRPKDAASTAERAHRPRPVERPQTRPAPREESIVADGTGHH